MPLCSNCTQGLACSNESCSASPVVGATAEVCEPQKGGIWVFVCSDAGAPVRGVTARKGADDVVTGADGLAKFDLLDAATYDVGLAALPGDLAALYEPAPAGTQPVPVVDGVISRPVYELKRKAALKVRLAKAGDDDTVFAGATVSATGGPQVLADVTTSVAGVADFGMVKAGRYAIRVVLGDAHKADFDTTIDFTARAHDVDVGAGAAVTVPLTAAPIVYDLANVAAPTRIAPGNDAAFRFSFDITNSNGKAVTSGSWEVRRKRDNKVIKTAVPLTPDQMTAGNKSLAWDGAVNAGDADFPDSFATIEHSPYVIAVTIGGGKGAKSGTVDVKVEVATFAVTKAAKTTLAADKDKAVWDQVPGLPASDVVELKLRSNIFMTANAEMNDSTAYTEYATYWGAGPRIPLIASVTVYNSSDAEVKAGRALGRARVLWDYTEPPQSRTTYLATEYLPPPASSYSHGAKQYVDRALKYDQVNARPKGGDNCHVSRGGKRAASAGADPVMAPIDSEVTGFPYDVAAGTTRWWAAFSAFKKTGAEESQAGVVFRPSRMAGDSYAVTAYLDINASLDVADDAIVSTGKSVAVGTFEVWREITIPTHLKKSSAVTGVMPSIDSQYQDAYIRVTNTSGGVTEIAKAAYDTAFTAAAAAVTTAAAPIIKYSRVPGVSHHGEAAPTKWVGAFRMFDAFKAAVKTGEALDDVGTEVLLANADLADAASYGKATAWYANELVEHMAKTFADKEGVTILQFLGSTEPDDFSGVTLNGAACAVSRHNTAFALYQTGGDTAQTPAHEIGHTLMLPHSPRIEGTLQETIEGIMKNRHDRRNRNCIMSYARPREGFCGLCVLRLRGWKDDQFTQYGPVDPQLTSIAPTGGAAGSVVNVTLTGTGFVAGSTVAVTGAGVTVSDVVVTPATSITAKLTIAGDAAGSPYFVTVKTPKGETPNVEFAVTPVIAAVDLTHLAIRDFTYRTKVTGANFVTGATASVSGAGVTVTGVTNVVPGECLIDFTLDAGASPGDIDVTVSTIGGTSAVKKLTLVPHQEVTTLAPTSGIVGTAVDITIDGANFHTSSTLELTPPEGVVVSNLVVGAARITARLTLAPTAPFGERKLRVVAAGSKSAPKSFTVTPPAPTLTTVDPVQSVVGDELIVTLTGTNFNTATAVNVSGAGISVTTFNVVSGTEIKASLEIEADATPDARDVTVVTPAGTTLAGVFTLVLPPPPTVTTLTPATGVAGTTLEVEVAGTNFVAMTNLSFGPGITVDDTEQHGATGLTLTITIDPAAAAGRRDFVLTTAGGAAAAVRFDVTLPPAPTITTIAPIAAMIGTTVDVVVTGTNFVEGSEVKISGAGVTPAPKSPDSATQITSTVTLDPAAAAGKRNLTVTTAGGTSAPVEFEAKMPPIPTIATIIPSAALAGTDVMVTITGTDFIEGATAQFGLGITVRKTTIVSLTEMKCKLRVAPTATAGARNATVTTAAGTSAVEAFAVQVPTAPTITSIAPARSEVNKDIVVTITGTDFLAVQSVTTDNAGIDLDDYNVETDTKITASLEIAPSAAVGVCRITVTTSGGSASRNFTVDPPPGPVITSIVPASGAIGSRVQVTINGRGLEHITAVEITGAGLSIDEHNVWGDDIADATIVIGAAAVAGPATLTVRTADGASGTGTFNVT